MAAARRGSLLFLLSATLLLPFCPRAYALNPRLDISQYAHTSWKTSDGFLHGAITSIAQTPDGYLWLGTDSGLYRFDGVRAVAWQPRSNRHLLTNTISKLLSTRDGTLWIGTTKGLASWKDGELTQYPELDGMEITGIVQDTAGVIWAAGFASSPPGKLCAIQHEMTQCAGNNGILGHGAIGLFADSKANLWVGMPNGLWRWKPGPPKFFPLPDEAFGIRGLAQDDDGALLISMTGRIARLVREKLAAAYLYPNPARGLYGQTLLRDQSGSLWIGTVDAGLVHVFRGGTDLFGESDGLSGSVVSALLEDREGDVWAGTTSGLDRFRDFTVVTLSVKEGFPCTSPIASFTMGRDGSIWQGSAKGLCRWHDGQITIYHEPNSRSVPSQPGVAVKAQEMAISGFPKHAVMTVFEDQLGRTWIFATGGVGYLQNGRFTRLIDIPGGHAPSISGDTKGNLWVANWEHGLLHIVGERLVEEVPWTTFRGKGYAESLAPDPLQGGVWLGFFNGGLAHFDSGRLSTSYTAADGLGEGTVSDLRFDSDGSLWAATEGGLSRLKSGRITTLSSANGLPCRKVHWSIEDDDHNLWLYMNCGLVRIAYSELEAWESDPSRRIISTLFDSSDGVWTRAFPGHGVGLPVAKSRDGRLWFATAQGLSIIDPHHLNFNEVPPPVHIEQITGDQKSYGTTLTSKASVRLPAHVRYIQIDYTALSFVAPQKVFFRYKLDGWDRDWQDAGSRRQAFYSNLPPGHYRFLVTASNNSGVWNEQGATLRFSIAPAYWQTNWFRALWAAAFLLLLWTIYWLRLRQVTRAFNMTLEARVNERTRIARELHDTLLQSFQGLLLYFHAVQKLLPERPAQAKEDLEIAIDRTARAITEGRGAVQGLRIKGIEGQDLAAAIRALAEELTSERSLEDVVVRVDVQGTSQPLRPIVHDEIYQIGAEALRNALRHARASKVTVELCYGKRQLELRVRDNGAGIDAKTLSDNGVAGHFGLHGMRERAELIGGRLTIWTAGTMGTEIDLTAPAGRAYVAASPHRVAWRRKKHFRG